jgi:hypothetical protein
MYAISHAAAALAIKRRWPRAGLWVLLVAVQAIELLWVAFVYAGIEYPEYTANAVHLGFLPYSHSVTSAAVVAFAAWAYGRFGKRDTALAMGLVVGILSHVVLDIVQHERDIMLLPSTIGPALGLNLAGHTPLDLVVELLFGVGCWWIFGGTLGLLIAIVLLNLANLPLMFPQPGSGKMLADHHLVLPTIILAQIIITWTVVWWFADQQSPLTREERPHA